MTDTAGYDQKHLEAIEQWQAAFMLNYHDMHSLALWHFRDKQRGEREESAARTMGNAWRDFARMQERGKTLEETTELLPNIVSFAAKHVRMGRDVGNSQDAIDALSEYAHMKHEFKAEALPDYDTDSHASSSVDALIDKKALPSDQAALRVDYGSWLDRLNPKKRRIAMMLATGEDRADICREAEVGAARLSQIKGELAESWEDMHAGCEPERGR